MINLTFSATVDLIDVDKYRAAVRTEMRRVFMKAGQKFLLKAIPRIPVWAGMARGAFRNAEDIFGKVTNDVTSGVRIRTTQGRGTAGRGGGEKITQTYRRGYYYTPPGGSKIERTPQSGRQFATPSDKILELSGAALASGKHSFYFRFSVNITYFTKLDDKWGAFKAGSAALEEYLRANITLPDPLKFTTRKTVGKK
jgi:hypothetical protein